MRITEAVDPLQALNDLLDHDCHEAHASLLGDDSVLPLVEAVTTVRHQDLADFILDFIPEQLWQPIVLAPLGSDFCNVLV